jgi:hypothetical protein
MDNYIFLISCAVILYIAFLKIIDLITILRIRKGLSNKIKIIINDNETVVINSLGHVLFCEPNNVLYIDNKGKKKKILIIGMTDNKNEINSKFNRFALNKKEFVKEFDEVIEEIDDFWYQYITYYVLKSKRRMEISAFIIVSASVSIEVSSTIIKDKIKLEFEKAIETKRPKFYNIIDIT